MDTNTASKLKLAASGDHVLVMTREFKAPREMIFEAWTKPDLLRRWLVGPVGWTMTICEIDLRVGGTYRYEWQHENGQQMGVRGIYQEIVPGERLVASEEFDDSWYPGVAITSTILTESSGVTTVETIVTYDTVEARDGVLRSPMESGVAASYDRLERILAAT